MYNEAEDINVHALMKKITRQITKTENSPKQEKQQQQSGREKKWKCRKKKLPPCHNVMHISFSRSQKMQNLTKFILTKLLYPHIGQTLNYLTCNQYYIHYILTKMA
jgi:hypothetical protein